MLVYRSGRRLALRQDGDQTAGAVLALHATLPGADAVVTTGLMLQALL